MHKRDIASMGAAALAACLAAGAGAAQLAEDPDHVEAGAMANPGASYELPTIQVISTTPLPGSGIPLEKVPSNVQTLNSRDLAGRGYDNLSEALSGALGLSAGAAAAAGQRGGGHGDSAATRTFKFSSFKLSGFKSRLTATTCPVAARSTSGSGRPG